MPSRCYNLCKRPDRRADRRINQRSVAARATTKPCHNCWLIVIVRDMALMKCNMNFEARFHVLIFSSACWKVTVLRVKYSGVAFAGKLSSNDFSIHDFGPKNRASKL